VSRTARSAVAALLVLAVAVGTWVVYSLREAQRFHDAKAVLTAKSEIRLRLNITHDKGPYAQETYTLSDIDGLSSAAYRVAGRNNIAVTVEMKPYQTYDVSFAFGKLVQDGLWDLRSKPERGDVSTIYEVTAFQAIEGKSGSHRFTFTDPHYWATAREFEIHLEKGKALPDLLVLQANARDKRYEAIVGDFRAFGTKEFQEEIARAQARASEKS
jgi:hypothetical protein